ncbi:kinase-like domain-containing protein [Fomitopsis betulina]|nr:kinase-like domain-containing protein [Fomitopsis betulina]
MGGVPKIVLTEDDERSLCAEMITAVSLLHRHKIVHRDIKPDNFLVDPAGGAILADFGLSIEAEPYARLTDLCGTEDYTAPEQHRCDFYDSQVDVWQLACTLIELFAGLRDTWISTAYGNVNPLTRGLPEDKLQAMLWKSVEELLPYHPATNLILEMLRVDPADRPTIEELKEYKWFDGIDWEEITYGPSAKRSFEPYHVSINKRYSMVYSTFFRGPKPQRSPAVEKTLQKQMDMYERDWLAFIYPPPLGPDYTA